MISRRPFVPAQIDRLSQTIRTTNQRNEPRTHTHDRIRVHSLPWTVRFLPLEFAFSLGIGYTGPEVGGGGRRRNSNEPIGAPEPLTVPEVDSPVTAR